jgi:formate dehydrogenase maturation protein FdhE
MSTKYIECNVCSTLFQPLHTRNTCSNCKQHEAQKETDVILGKGNDDEANGGEDDD